MFVMCLQYYCRNTTMLLWHFYKLLQRTPLRGTSRACKFGPKRIREPPPHLNAVQSCLCPFWEPKNLRAGRPHPSAPGGRRTQVGRPTHRNTETTDPHLNSTTLHFGTQVHHGGAAPLPPSSSPPFSLPPSLPPSLPTLWHPSTPWGCRTQVGAQHTKTRRLQTHTLMATHYTLAPKYVLGCQSVVCCFQVVGL